MASFSKITPLPMAKLLSQICSLSATAPTHPFPSSASTLVSFLKLRRSAHTSVYDKNFDEKIRNSNVPDEVVEPLSEKYWGPHPETGVFGPIREQSGAVENEQTTVDGGESSVLEQKAWFRHTNLEDPEKHHSQLP